ncbi:MAG: hypothetical protein AB9880_00725 [Christensenellales bacterium]
MDTIGIILLFLAVTFFSRMRQGMMKRPPAKPAAAPRPATPAQRSGAEVKGRPAAEAWQKAQVKQRLATPSMSSDYTPYEPATGMGSEGFISTYVPLESSFDNLGDFEGDRTVTHETVAASAPDAPSAPRPALWAKDALLQAVVAHEVLGNPRFRRGLRRQ